MAYPQNLPVYLGFVASHTLSADGHAAQHNQEQADIVAIATKLGIGVSTPSANLVLRSDNPGSTSWDKVHAATDISGTLSVSNGGTNATTITDARGNLSVYSKAEVDALIANVTASVAAAKQALYPVGIIYTELTGVNPAVTFGFGTWISYAPGQALVGFSSGDPNFGTVGGVTGATSHFHWQTVGADPATGYIEIDGSGSGQTRVLNLSRTTFGAVAAGGGTSREDGTYTASSIQPSVTIYVWERTA